MSLYRPNGASELAVSRSSDSREPENLDPGFAFTLALRDKEFRAAAAAAGYCSGMTVVAIEPGADWSFAEALASGAWWDVFLARQTDLGGWEFRILRHGQFRQM